MESPPESRETTPSVTKRSKGKNFTLQEDEQLCRSWLNITQDAVAGIGQKSETFWGRIHGHYDEFKSTTFYRSEESLQNRWGTISKVVSKFCGFLAQVEARERSGATSTDKMADAKRLYLEIQKSNFTLDHCWTILRHAKKWEEFLTVKRTPRKAKSKSMTAAATDPATGASAGASAGAEGAKADERPAGRKAEKEERKRKREDGDMVGVMKEVASNQAAMRAELKRKNDNYDREVDAEIMGKDTSEMTEEQQEFYAIQRKMILAKWAKLAANDGI